MRTAEARKRYHVDPPLEQHAIDVGLAFTLRFGDNGPIGDDLGHIGALLAKFLGDNLPADIGVRQQDAEAPHVPGVRDRADECLRAELRRGHIGLQAIPREALGRRRSHGAELHPFELPQVELAREQALHERVDRVRTGEHDEIKPRCLSTRGVERRVVLGG